VNSTGSASPPGYLASVVVPAHDEASSIGRLLDALTEDAAPGELEITVVCNGCTDDTAEVAAAYRDVAVVTTPVPSKREALRLGDASVATFPRLYVDADVVLSTASVRRLVSELATGSVLAAGPDRELPRQGMSRLVEWYYDVWESLPSVRNGLFGRGVVALSKDGYTRIRELPAVMADDLAFSEAFSPRERSVVQDARVTVYPPRNVRDLLRRRTRAHTGISQADALGVRARETRTGWRDLARISARPRMLLRMPVFVGVTVVARARARRAVARGDFDTWLRDESSRADVTTERRVSGESARSETG
jgi:hypothetical protein